MVVVILKRLESRLYYLGKNFGASVLGKKSQIGDAFQIHKYGRIG